jgi:hypothetical protein
MKKLTIFIFAFTLFFSFIRTQDEARAKLEFLPDEDFHENEVVARKRVEDVLKWMKRYLDEIIASKNRTNSNSTPLEREVIDYVMNLDRPNLIELAYTLEKYHRRVTGGKDLMGGLHDYVFKIPDDQMRNYIFDKLNEHSEIAKKDKLIELVKESKSQTEESHTHDRDFIVAEGIHEYLKALPRKSLEKLALGLENYHRKIRDEFLLGGLHDYINQISEEDLSAYILKEANEHAEINSVQKLDEFVNGQSLNLVEDKLAPELLEFINKADREKLLKILRKILSELKFSAEESALICMQMRDKAENYIRDYIKNRINSFPDILNKLSLYNDLQ